MQDLQVFVMRLEEINSAIRVPSEVVTSLWYSLAEVLSEIFVDGYVFSVLPQQSLVIMAMCKTKLILPYRFSNAKRCSNGGRALMQLDFTQLMSKLEVLSAIKPIPKREYVENYVKAFYLPETHFQSWIQEHKVSTE